MATTPAPHRFKWDRHTSLARCTCGNWHITETNLFAAEEEHTNHLRRALVEEAQQRAQGLLRAEQ